MFIQTKQPFRELKVTPRSDPCPPGFRLTKGGKPARAGGGTKRSGGGVLSVLHVSDTTSLSMTSSATTRGAVMMMMSRR